MDILHHHGFPLSFLSSASLRILPIIFAMSSLTNALNATGEVETGRQKTVPVGYYNFVVLEYSYKFWAIFTVSTLIILVYSCIAAVWLSVTVYAPPPVDYDNYDFINKRTFSKDFEDDEDNSSSLSTHPSPRTTRRILSAISSPPNTT